MLDRVITVKTVMDEQMIVNCNYVTMVTRLCMGDEDGASLHMVDGSILNVITPFGMIQDELVCRSK